MSVDGGRRHHEPTSTSGVGLGARASGPLKANDAPREREASVLNTAAIFAR